MKIVKQALRPDHIRNTPEQFSWVDQALVQHHLIDRCNSHSAALYLFLITVADSQGLSYYASATLAGRLHLSESELAAARTQLMALELIAWQAPLYQVLALPGTRPPASPARHPTRPVPPARPTPAPNVRLNTGPLSLAQLLVLERSHAQL